MFGIVCRDALLFGGSLFAETIGAVVGGGSFIIQPLALLTGLNVHQAVAADVAASSLTSVTGLATLRNAGRTPAWSGRLLAIVAAAIGAVIGAIVMTWISEAVLALVFVFAALGVTVQVFVAKFRAPAIDQPRAVPLLAAAIFLGLYTGLSGAGSGTIAIAVLTRCGLTPIGAVAVRKMLFIPATFAAAIFYSLHGWLVAAILLPMLLASALAGWLGTRLMVRLGDQRLAIVFRFATLAFALLSVWRLFHA